MARSNRKDMMQQMMAAIDMTFDQEVASRLKPERVVEFRFYPISRVVVLYEHQDFRHSAALQDPAVDRIDGLLKDKSSRREFARIEDKVPYYQLEEATRSAVSKEALVDRQIVTMLISEDKRKTPVIVVRDQSTLKYSVLPVTFSDRLKLATDVHMNQAASASGGHQR